MPCYNSSDNCDNQEPGIHLYEELPNNNDLFFDHYDSPASLSRGCAQPSKSNKRKAVLQLFATK